MSVHAFDPKIAEKVGLNAAVIYHNILFWCAKNLANERNVHEGVAWTYNSTQAFQRQFPYLSADQIRHALSKLEEEGLIRVGNFNQSPMDRTKWYSAVGQMDLGYFPDAIRNNPEAIPDSKPDIKPDEKRARDSEPSLFPSIDQPESKVSTSEAFEELWNKYPKEGRKDKAAAKKKFAAIVKSGVDPAKIISAAETYARWLKGGAPGEFRPQAKHLTTWLNKGSYEDEIDAPPPSQASAARWYEDQIER